MRSQGWRGRAKARTPESEPRSQGCAARSVTSMPLPCGQSVDNCLSRDFVPVGLSVDRKALIVRNPRGTVQKQVNVDERWKTERTCSLSYFLLPVKVDHGIHNPPVLTGTTTVLEFSRR